MIGIGYQMYTSELEKCALPVCHFATRGYQREREFLLRASVRISRQIKLLRPSTYTCETSNGAKSSLGAISLSLSFTPTHFSTGPIFAAWLNNMIEKSAAASCAPPASHLTAEMCEIAPPREGTSPGRHSLSHNSVAI